MLLFTCGLSRATHLQLVSNQTTEEFIRNFKKLISRGGVPEKIYSDHAKTIIASWILVKKLNKLEALTRTFNINKIQSNPTIADVLCSGHLVIVDRLFRNQPNPGQTLKANPLYSENFYSRHSL